MRVSREQATENRKRIVDTASRLFRERGFDGIGVADLMKAAGMTHGGFYKQFRSKDDLAVEACETALTGTAATWNSVAAAGGEEPLANLVAFYLSPQHRDRPGSGCIYAALAADVARSGNADLKQAFANGLEPLIDVISRTIADQPDDRGRDRALATLSTLFGSLLLSRAVGDSELSDKILAAARASILERDGPA
ncbi:TetR/AcrR family transcriptional regulator [Indioceanicola profundi]|uniref:TetR/AcrR family transcriptional regulator n=1 Tax=Indioceanicola profundi TaxID=2220096 RepID=UPI000E6AC8E7|nr:TetR/AcrR family transcriptional regulator [Indioceanicola profundi]